MLKKSEYMAHTQESVPLEAKTLDLPDKDLKSAILNMSKELKETMSKG